MSLKNNTIIPELTSEGFILARARLKNSPSTLAIFESKGIKRESVMQLPIGLSNEEQIFMPMYNDEMRVVGVFFVNPTLESGHFESTTEESGIIGLLAKDRDTLIITDTFLELLYVWQEGYNSVCMVIDPYNINQRIFDSFETVITLHHDDKILRRINKPLRCAYLESEYRGGPIGNTSFAKFSDIEHVQHNPFVLSGKLYWFVSSKALRVIGPDNEYEVRRRRVGDIVYYSSIIDGVGEVELPDPLRFAFNREKIDTEKVYRELYRYLKENLYFCNKDQVMLITYFVMFTYVYPHAITPFNLQVYFSNHMWLKVFRTLLNTVMPSPHICKTAPYVNFVLKYDPTSFKDFTPMPIVICDYTRKDLIGSGIPFILDEETGCKENGSMLGYHEGAIVRNKLINWSLDYEFHIYKGKPRKEPWMNTFGMIVRNSDAYGKIYNQINRSKELLYKVKDGTYDTIKI